MIQHYQQIAERVNWNADCIDKKSLFNDGDLIAMRHPTSPGSIDLRLSITEEKMSLFTVIASELDTPQLHHFNPLVPASVTTLAPTSNNSVNSQISQYDFETKRFKPNYFCLS
ncbi:hypothetical protein QN372_15860 [Undibacterium sp. RTI2.1]|uniref:hypothetical protein n=1 Tax=unclassified Undibacterium TaxID=2630295 RepID=UPI002AB4CD37|nr:MULTISPECIES: hypothetical protein [unclassified Undibacterium]MDY7536755.1 hypothetical protein [Undibacterium sp. 5I1]MEB0032234.1 hypothetical protein [Undibacterium sp. RTI2.1]MEB0115766.1 hypothetical protein [Undibacterium sp. RTI2.2]MEB0231909.1 hypothetical protein [Undibacterium sp. 10I3]MEB0256637.1 hypothetical protein [Undibacterium sp. 5I1]